MIESVTRVTASDSLSGFQPFELLLYALANSSPNRSRKLASASETISLNLSRHCPTTRLSRDERATRLAIEFLLQTIGMELRQDRFKGHRNAGEHRHLMILNVVEGILERFDRTERMRHSV